MKKFFGIGLILALSAIGAFAQSPNLDKMSLNITLRTHRGQPEWRFTPKIGFEVRGKMSDAAKTSVEFTDPAGKQFVRLDCELYTQDEDWKSVSDCGNDLEATAASTLTGIYGFQIKLSDRGASSTLYSGKFTVGKYLFNPAKNPAFNKNFYYYIDYDWRLPVAFVGVLKGEYTPPQLFAWTWIKAEQSEPEATAQLVYKGKTVAETSFGADMTYSTEENDAVEFSRLKFRFNAVAEKPESESYAGWWKLYENPGEYEIRVLRKGVLARVFKFTVGKDGKPVESGIGKEIREGYQVTALPVRIEGTADGALNRTLLNSGWWGNPISGLAPQ
jgi:hypothetical protein